MSNIRINVWEVFNAGKKAQKSGELINTTKNSLNAIKNTIDPQILSKNNISNQFSSLNSKLQSIKNSITSIRAVTERNISEYEKVDREIALKLRNMNISKNM